MEYCCTNCFQDEWLIDFIEEHGEQIEECDFCKSDDVMAIDLDQFELLISPVVGLYSAVTNYYPIEFMKERDMSEQMLWDKLTDDWCIFNDSMVGESILSSIYADDPRDGTFHDFMNDAVDIEDDWYGQTHEYSKLWGKFCYEIRHRNRFAPKTFARDIIDQIIEANEKILDVGTTLYRSRIQKDKKLYKIDEMGPPPEDYATFGRLNPQGIAYLYLSDNPQTCVFEVRPDSTDEVRLGTFEITHKCKLVELTSEFIGSPFKWGDSFSMIYTYKRFLKEFGEDISKPANPKSSYLDYLPTQFVSEYIKNKGYDGIIFKSSGGKGLNYTLFNHELARCLKVQTASNITIDYSFKLSKN